MHDARTGKLRGGSVGVVARVEHDDFVARAHDGVDRREQGLGAAGRDRDLAGRVDAPGRSGAPLPSAIASQSAGRPAIGAYWLWPRAQVLGDQLRAGARAASKSGNPWPRLIAPASAASRDITVKIVVPTPGSLLSGSGITRLAGDRLLHVQFAPLLLALQSECRMP